MSKILELREITKAYPGVVALDNVSMSFQKGEVHAIMGENGAGKSTLIKTIAGAISADNGTIIMNGTEFRHMTPAISRDNGIGVIYQEFNLIPSMSVAENIFMGDKIGGKIKVDFNEMTRRTEEIFGQLNVTIPAKEMVASLSTAQQQLVEIAKAIVKDCKVLIMDEPSAAIAVSEVEQMFKIVRKLKNEGVTIIYISHRMDEIFEIADRVSVMRDGKYIDTCYVKDINRKQLITMMVGRELNESFPVRNVQIGKPVLELKKVTGNGDFEIDLTLKKGEILGLAGLVGAGRTELAKMIFGSERIQAGEVVVKGSTVDIKSPSHAISLGIGLIPEDRKNEGAFLEFPIDWNISIMSLTQISKLGIVKQADCDKLAGKYSDILRIKTPSLKQLVRNLSGGNQQKVVLAKVLAAKTDIIIFDEPTRGIDVGAKQEIYKLMNSLVEQGISIIMISSEMEELLGMSDRIMVLHQGRITGELDKSQFSQNAVLELASGI